MRKLLHLSKLTLLALSFSVMISSCTEKIVFENRDLMDFVVTPEMWTWDPVDECYFCNFNYQQLTEFKIEQGIFTASALIEPTWRPLPYTSWFDFSRGRVSETINFEYSPRFLRFNIIASDKFASTEPTYKPGTFVFKTTLIW